MAHPKLALEILSAGGSKSKAAEILAIHRRLLYEKICEYGINDAAA